MGTKFPPAPDGLMRSRQPSVDFSATSLCSLGTIKTRAQEAGVEDCGAGLTIGEGVQVAKDAKAIVGPFGGHSQLPQGGANLYQERGGKPLSRRGKRKLKKLVHLGLVGRPGEREAEGTGVQGMEARVITGQKKRGPKI